MISTEKRVPPKCGTCVHFLKAPALSINTPNPNQGSCHFSPPTTIFVAKVSSLSPLPQFVTQSHWPAVDALHDYCAQHEPVEPPPPQPPMVEKTEKEIISDSLRDKFK